MSGSKVLTQYGQIKNTLSWEDRFGYFIKYESEIRTITYLDALGKDGKQNLVEFSIDGLQTWWHGKNYTDMLDYVEHIEYLLSTSETENKRLNNLIVKYKTIALEGKYKFYASYKYAKRNHQKDSDEYQKSKKYFYKHYFGIVYYASLGLALISFLSKKIFQVDLFDNIYLSGVHSLLLLISMIVFGGYKYIKRWLP